MPDKQETPLIEIAANDARLIANGYEPVALIGKRALGHQWTARPNSLEAIAAERAALPEATNTGARTGRFCVADIDLVPADHAERMKALALEVLGHTLLERIGSKGMALCYRNETPIGKITIAGLHSTMTHSANGKTVPLPGKVEMLGTGQQLAIYGEHPVTGRSFGWPNDDLDSEPLKMPLSDVREVTPEKLREFARRAKALMKELGYRDVTVSEAGAIKHQDASASHATGKCLSWEGLRERLSYIHPRFDGARPTYYPLPSRKRQNKPLPYDGEAWLKLALCLRDGNVPLLNNEPHDWMSLTEEWSSGELWFERTGKWIDVSDRLPWQGIPNRLKGEARKSGNRTGIGTILDYAADGGCPLPLDDEPFSNPFEEGAGMDQPPEHDATAVTACQQPVAIVAAKGSEIELASEFAETGKDRLRYVAAEKKWFAFDGNCWREDTTKAVRDIIRGGLARRSIATQDWREAQKIASNRFIAGVEAIAQTDRRLAATIEQWDADPAILCTPGGIVDLTTGTLRPATPEDYCRKTTSVAPAEPGTPFPIFQSVLDRLTGGDKSVERYLQKIAGYCLFGEQREKLFFIVAGEHDSGKTTVFEALREVMGDYATSATAETFLEDPRNQARSTNDLAELIGYRLVVASEPDKNRSLSASRIKRMIGRDSDRVRRLYQSGTVQQTTWKPVLHCNDVPHLGHGDEAVKSRLRIIPGGRTIPENQRDPDLAAKLRAEHPAILRWMIEGCALWQKEGLAQPAAVADRSRQYFESEDPLAEWLQERTERDPTAWTSTHELYDGYRKFTRGSVPLDIRAFGARVASIRWDEADAKGNTSVMSFRRMKRHTGQGFAGIRLRTPEPSDAHSDDLSEFDVEAL